jgi:hypothetical protein
MKDSDFKNAAHPIGNLVIATRGSAVSKGYKPDVTVKNSQGQLKFILESEQKTDRKAFLGDLLKAEMHAEQQGEYPELVIVMQPSGNTTTQQIADHMRPYKQWLENKKGGVLNVSTVQVLSDTEYLDAIAAGEQLGSATFKIRGHIL